MAKTLSILQKVQSLKARYHQNAIHKESLIQLIAQSEVSEHVYNSNAIENSTLTLDETQKILLEIDLERYINQRELFEAKNLARVVGYINSVATQKEMDLEMILFLHKMLLTHINDDIAGRFRKGDEWVRVGSYIAPDPKYVVDRLLKLLVDYHAKSDWHIVKKMAFFHLTFEHIHPFVDGNGRIGRVLNNYFLIREGLVPINIQFINRQLYYDAFRQFQDDNKTSIMEEIIGKALTNSYHKRLAYLESKEIVLLSEYSKREKVSHSNLINKAHRQTIEAFYEKGVWKIGV